MFYFNLTTNYYKNEEKLQLLFEAAKSILGQLEIWCSVLWPKNICPTDTLPIAIWRSQCLVGKAMTFGQW
jgi:hypothetical protein